MEDHKAEVKAKAKIKAFEAKKKETKDQIGQISQGAKELKDKLAEL